MLFITILCEEKTIRPVNPNRIRKSLGAENTFDYDLIDPVDMKMALDPILTTVFKRLQKAETFGKTVTLKVKFKDFSQITRSTTQTDFVDSGEQLKDLTFKLLDQIEWSEFPQGVRLLGVTCSNFEQDEADTTAEKIGYQLTIDF